MKLAGSKLGEHKITADAVIPGLIYTALTGCADRSARATGEGGKQPSGGQGEDKQAARSEKASLGKPGIEPDQIAQR